MENLKIYYDETGQTLTVWFDDPNEEFIVDEVDEELALIKNKNGKVIGFERINYKIIQPQAVHLELISA